MRRLLHLPFYFALLTVLCTCGPAPKISPTTVVGNVRYNATNQLMVATLNISPVDTIGEQAPPTLLGSAMPPLERAGPGSFRTRRQLHFPGNLQMTLPCGQASECVLDYTFNPVFSDSIPSEISLAQTVAFPVATAGLEEQESLVIFFEPIDRSNPKRIQLVGPTDTGILTLPKNAMEDIPEGDYQVYLIKQQLFQDSTAYYKASIQTEFFSKNVMVNVRQ